MTRDLSHAEAVEMLPDAALDVLPADEQTAVLAHAASCPECGPALAVLRDAAAYLAYALPQMADDPVRRARVRTRLLARARADLAVADVPAATTGPASAAAPDGGTDRAAGARPPAHGGSARRARSAGGSAGGPARPVRPTVLPWSVAALAALAAAAVVFLSESRSAREIQRTAAESEATGLRAAALQDSLVARDSVLNQLTGRQVSAVRLTAGAPEAPWAWMFWNHATNHWTLLAHAVPAPPPGRAYQLWLVTPKTRISAGTFTPEADGSAKFEATYPLAPDSLRAIAVTEEPAGGAAQPTGPLVIQGVTGSVTRGK